ncbi:Electron transport complex protein RnfG [compost metagenome]
MQAFAGKDRNTIPDTLWALRKDNGQFDQVTGATITSRAVLHAVHDALRYFDEHAGELQGDSGNE